METINIHVPNLYHLQNRVVREFEYSQSSNSSMLNEADLIRAKSFFSAIRVSVGIIGEPGKLDLPESDPITYPLRPMDEPKDIENQVMAHLALLVRTMQVELVRSQSSRNSSGLNVHDRGRQLAICDEAEKFISASEQIQPLDLVESSPRAPMQGPGRNTLGNK